MKKKRILILSALILGVSLVACKENENATSSNNTPKSEVASSIESSSSSTTTLVPSISSSSSKVEENELLNQGALGFIDDSMPDFTAYLNTDAYVSVSTPSELFEALMAAKNDYTSEVTNALENTYIVRKNVRKNETNWTNALNKGLYLKNADGTFTKIDPSTPWDANDTTYTSTMTYYEDSPLDEVIYSQSLIKEGSVHVIEIKNDLDLGYKKLTSDDKSLSIVKEFSTKNDAKYTKSSMYEEYGMSQIAIERTNNLLIFSKNGAKITHGGFKINYSKNIAVRNLVMDEMWQWEDSSLSSTAKVGDYDAYGWAYFKIGFSDNIWIDHMTFGKSFDGQIDVANPSFSTKGTYKYAPYEAGDTSSVHISWCKFMAGSDDKDGYLYKMMQEIEADYQNKGNHYLYYNKLRDSGISFEDILYGIAIPQKKAFLLGDSGDEYKYNLKLNVSIANCYFKNIEDRLPKIRGGNAYLYNSIIDNFNYIEYRNKLKSLNAQSLVQSVNSSWKCALVSQGIVCGNGGSVRVEGTIFRGIEYLLKNNDSTLTNNAKYPNATASGGYLITDSSYQYLKDSEIIYDASKMPNSTSGILKTDNFKWNTKDGKALFEPIISKLADIEDILLNSKYAAGTNLNMSNILLETRY